MKTKHYLLMLLCTIANGTLPSTSFAQSIAAGASHTLVVCDYQVQVWGFNLYGQFGNGTNTDSYLPTSVPLLTNVISLDGGSNFSLFLKNDGTVWASGGNIFGQLGDGTNTDSNIPVQVSSLTNAIAIAAGWEHSIALKNDSTVWTWGNNG